MTLFRLDASIRTEGSVSRQVADSVELAWAAAHPSGAIVRRDVGSHPLPSTAWSAAVGAGYTPAEQRSAAQVDAIALAGELADELLLAEAYIFALPLYNFGVPAQFKAWVDLVIADPRFGPGSEKPLAGRSAVLVTARGGGYGAGTPREGWDHGTPWEHRILVDVFGLDLHHVVAELTLAGVVPAMAALVPMAEQSLAAAHETAQLQGATLAERVGQAV